MSKGIWVDSNTFIDFAATPATEALTREIATRQTAWDFSGLIGLLPDPDPVLSKRGDGAEVLASLTADDHLTSVIQTRKVGTMKREIRWKPGAEEGREPDQGAVALAAAWGKDLQSIDGDVGLRNVIAQILDAPLYGFTPLELSWQPGDGRIRLAKIESKPHAWFKFNDENQPRYVSRAMMDQGEEIPWGKIVFARHFPTYENPYGLRLLSRCFWPVTFKRGGLKFWVTFCEKYGMPFLLGRYPRGTGPAEQQKMLSDLVAMVQDAVAVVPEGSTVELLGAGGNAKGSSDLFDRLVSVMDKSISKVIVGQTLTSETSDTGGAYAQSKTHQDVLADYQASDQALVKETFDKIATIYAAINAPNTAPPKFTWYEEDDPQQEFAERDKTVSESGVKFTKIYYVRRYGYAEDEIEVVDHAPPAQAGQRPPSGSNPLPAENTGGGATAFAEPPRFTPEQQALETLAASCLAKASEALATGEQAILDAVMSAETYDQAMANLLDLYPALDLSGLQDLLARAMFNAELHGRSTVVGAAAAARKDA